FDSRDVALVVWALNSRGSLPTTRVMSIESTIERVSAIRQALADPATMLSANAALTGGTEAPSSGGESPAGGESSFAAALAQASDGYQSPSTAGTATALGDQGLSTTANAALGYQGIAGAGLTGTDGLTGTSAIGYPGQPQSVDGVVGSSPVGSSEGVGGRIVAIAESQLGQAEQPPGSNESPAIAQYRSATEGAVPGAPWCAYFASWVARQAGVPLGQDGQGLGAVSEIWSWAQSTGRAVPNGPGVVPKPGDLIVFGDEHVGIVRAVLPNGQIETVEGNYENKVAANIRSPTEATGYVSMS
ncbi:MAG: CHAP domain-containing protein, partial [Solirubrobacteraceae bacterium]